MEKVIDGILVESQPCEVGANACKNCVFYSGLLECKVDAIDDTCCTDDMEGFNWKRMENAFYCKDCGGITVGVDYRDNPSCPAMPCCDKPKSECNCAEASPSVAPSHLTNRHFIDNLWRWKCGLPEEEEKPFEPIDIDKLANEQMSSRFIELMTNRMALGTLRYGRWQDNKKNGVKYDRVGSIRKRLQLFEETGNSEYLVDIANFAMIEFEISDHPNLHFSPKDDDGEHVERIESNKFMLKKHKATLDYFKKKLIEAPTLIVRKDGKLEPIRNIDPVPARPTKIAYKFPMSTNVMTTNGELWQWRIVNGKVVWLFISSVYLESSTLK